MITESHNLAELISLLVMTLLPHLYFGPTKQLFHLLFYILFQTICEEDKLVSKKPIFIYFIFFLYVIQNYHVNI